MRQTSVFLLGGLHKVVKAEKCAVLPRQTGVRRHTLGHKSRAGKGRSDAVLVQLLGDPVLLIALRDLAGEFLLRVLSLRLVGLDFLLNLLRVDALKLLQRGFGSIEAGFQAVALCREVCNGLVLGSLRGLNVFPVECEHLLDLIFSQPQCGQFFGFHG